MDRAASKFHTHLTDPYMTSAERRTACIKLLAFALCSMPVIVLFLHRLETYLWDSKFLNGRDLGFVGGESGTWWEYLTNAWHWDAALLLLMLLSLPSLIIGVILFWTLGAKPPRTLK